jgi:hypothetical protein
MGNCDGKPLQRERKILFQIRNEGLIFLI